VRKRERGRERERESVVERERREGVRKREMGGFETSLNDKFRRRLFL